MTRKNDVRAAVVVAIVIIMGVLFGKVGDSSAMVPEDILAMRQVGIADLSGDGRYLLYSLTGWDAQEAERVTWLYRRDLDTGQDLLIFTPENRSWGARWRPDGEAIAYLHNDDKGLAIWLMDPDGGRRRRLGGVPGPAGDLVWSPAGTALAWIQQAEVGEYQGEVGKYVVADITGYRHLGEGFRQGKRGQLFVMELPGGQVTRIVDQDLDIRSVCWSPTGRKLVLAAKAAADLGVNLNTDLFVVDRCGGHLHRLTHNPGPDEEPLWLAGGEISYRRGTDPLWESGPRTVAVIDARQGDADIKRQFGQGYDNLFWGYTEFRGDFYALGANRGCLDLVKFGRKGWEFATRTGHDFWQVRIAGHRAILLGAGHTLPSGIFEVDLAEKVMGPHQPRLVIDPNADWRNKTVLSEPEPFTEMVDGRPIEGWFFKPADLEKGQRIPVVLSIHGGPEWMYGGYFLPEFHILPRFGYGVVIANPTGSMGYGFEFQKGIRGDWVDRPAREVLACVARAVNEGWADPERLAVMGGSYGGHLAAALTTQTDQFQAAALDRMYPEPVSFWGTTDEKWFPEWEFMGKPWEPEAREVYRRNSPFATVDRVTTPTLISHGMKDYRCLIAGGEIWFSALQALGVPSRFIRFETEGHGIRDPENQVFYYQQLLRWFDTHVLDLDDASGPLVEPDPLTDG